MLFERYYLIVNNKKTPPHFYTVFEQLNEVSKVLS